MYVSHAIMRFSQVYVGTSAVMTIIIVPNMGSVIDAAGLWIQFCSLMLEQLILVPKGAQMGGRIFDCQ